MMKRKGSAMRTVLVAILCLVASVALLLEASADRGGSLEEATKLREASAADWNAGQYAAAVEKLSRAAEIYRGLRGDYNSDLATVHRALVYNQIRAGTADDALDSLRVLMDLVKETPSLEGELRTANAAFYNAAKAQRSLDEQLAILAPVRAAALEQESDKLAAQVAHDMAGMSRDGGKVPQAVDLFETAIAERDRIGDLVGKAWSLNNLANMYLREGMPDQAMFPLIEAYRLVHEDQVVDVQATLAVNLKDALKQLKERPGITADHARWLWRLAEAGAESAVAEVIPSDYLLREACAMTEHLEGSRAGHVLAKRLDKNPLTGQPVEVRANLDLAAARMAIDAGKAADAQTVLKKMDVGEGLCAAHLQARVHTLGALAAAWRKQKGAFDEQARQAVEAWDAVGDRGGQEEALAKLAPVAAKLKASSAPELEALHARLSQAGKPGGLGGSASGGGDRSGYKDLGLHDPLFEIEAVDGAIVIRDVNAKHETKVDVRWQPRSVGLNGLSLTVFGGWVRIDSLAYGGGAVTSGQPGTTTVEEMGAVIPVPGAGKLVILKNGAVTYVAD